MEKDDDDDGNVDDSEYKETDDGDDGDVGGNSISKEEGPPSTKRPTPQAPPEEDALEDNLAQQDPVSWKRLQALPVQTHQECKHLVAEFVRAQCLVNWALSHGGNLE